MLNLYRAGKPGVCAAKPIVSSQHARSFGSRGGPGRVIGLTVIGAAAAVGSAVAYSYADPKFRSTVEVKLPITKGLYKAVLGESVSSTPIQSINPPAQAKKLPDNQNEKKAGHAPTPVAPVAKPPTVSRSSDSKSSTELKKPSPLPEASSTLAVAAVVTEKAKNPYKGKDDAEKKNHQLDEALKSAIAGAEQMVRAATTAKLDTIRAVEYHIQTIREAVEAGPNADWKAVVDAHSAAKAAARKDIQAETDGRNYVDNLRKLINQGGQGETTVFNPLLAVSRETATKLSTEMDELNSLLKKVDSDQIVTREYGHLVEEGRKYFAKEIRAVAPDADFNADFKDLKRGQLGALLVHAHLKVDQLTRQLIEKQQHENARVKKVATESKAIQMEAVSQKELPPAQLKAEIAKIEKEFKEKLEKERALIAADFDVQLKRVVVTQKQLYDIEHAKDVENAVLSERCIHAVDVGKALAQLEGLEKALKSRVVQDAENRRSKQMWLAVQNLVDSVEFGKKGSCCMEGRRMPLDSQLKVLLSNSTDDQFVKTVCKSVEKTTRVRGEYTAEDIKTRLGKAIKVAHRVAWLDENGGGVAGYIMSWVRSSLRFGLPLKYKDADKFDPHAASNADLLERAAFYLRGSRVMDAVKLLQATKGPAKSVSADIVVDARRHEESLMLARLLLAHAAVTSIRSTY